jgi:RNA polymerase sigma factor (sigma-70 family)
MHDVEGLFREHHEPLFRYMVRFTGDAELAADATQEAFARMIESDPEYRHPKAWLYKVATNYARERARTRKRRAELAETAGPRLVPDEAPRPDDEAAARQAVARVRRGLAALSDRDRTVLLRREEGFTHREIADVVGATTGSVGTMIARALDKLALAIDLDQESVA